MEPDVYSVDTSAWLDIGERSDRNDVWKMIVRLIEEGRIVACAQVLTELHDDPIYMLKLKPYEKALLSGDRKSNDIEYLQHVGRITHDYPSMSKATGFKTPADPYVVALAELEGYVVVSNEKGCKRPNRKIPGVCCERKIRCITLDEFITANTTMGEAG